MKLISFLFLSLSLVACQKTSSTAVTASKVVNLAIWSNYITPEMVAKFEQSSGLKVQISNYSSNEELLAKLKAGASGIDVAVPSDYMVFAMAQMQMLEKLDTSKITSFADLDPKLLKKSYDPQNSVSLPFDWGTTGIAINRKLYKGSLKGWKDLFANKELEGKFSLLDDVRETLGAALKANGYSLNSTKAEEVKAAQKTLEGVRRNVKAFTSETLVGLVNSEMAVAHAYQCDALQAKRKTGGQIEFIIPEEGCTHWIDNVVIPRGAQNIEGAYSLINFLLSPEIAAERTKNIYVGPSNLKAIALLPEDIRNDPQLFLKPEQIAKCEMIQDVGESLVTWDQAWTALKASSQ